MRVTILNVTKGIGHSTDRLYLRNMLPRLREFVDVDVDPAAFDRHAFHENLDRVIGRIARPLGIVRERDKYRVAYARSASGDVTYAYGICPMEWTGPPIVLQDIFCPFSFIRDVNSTEVRLREQRLRAVSMATIVTTWTEASAAWFKRCFPEHTSKLVVTPPFLPDIERFQVSPSVKEGRSGPVRVIFLGHDARRKGIANLCKAYMELDEGTRRLLDVRVCSSFRDGRIKLPPGITSLPPTPNPKELYEWADVLIMPSLEESYGFVFIEAMMASCAIIAPDDAQRRSMIPSDGASFVDPLSSASIACALSGLALSRENVRSKQVSNFEYASVVHKPNHVASSYVAAFERALGVDEGEATMGD